MPFNIAALGALAVLASHFASARDAFTFCTEANCGDCPVSISTAGTGYPNCVVYDSDQVFPNHGFPRNAAGGGYEPYIDIGEQDPGCQVIVKSPANVDLQNCGYPIGAFGNPTCAVLDIKETFMVQFCCGEGDCTAAGADAKKRSAKWPRLASTSSTTGGLYLKYPNGTIIQPIQVGQPQTIQARSNAGEVDFKHLNARDGCDKNSWVADPDRSDYSRAADGSQVIYANAVGPAHLTITTERSQSYTSTLGASVGFSDILDLGVSIMQSFTREISDSRAITFDLEKGQQGNVVFTPFLRCSTGTGTCSGNKVHGEVCTPYEAPQGGLNGMTSLEVVS